MLTKDGHGPNTGTQTHQIRQLLKGYEIHAGLRARKRFFQLGGQTTRYLRIDGNVIRSDSQCIAGGISRGCQKNIRFIFQLFHRGDDIILCRIWPQELMEDSRPGGFLARVHRILDPQDLLTGVLLMLDRNMNEDRQYILPDAGSSSSTVDWST